MQLRNTLQNILDEPKYWLPIPLWLIRIWTAWTVIESMGLAFADWRKWMVPAAVGGYFVLAVMSRRLVPGFADLTAGAALLVLGMTPLAGSMAVTAYLDAWSVHPGKTWYLLLVGFAAIAVVILSGTAFSWVMVLVAMSLLHIVTEFKRLREQRSAKQQQEKTAKELQKMAQRIALLEHHFTQKHRLQEAIQELLRVSGKEFDQRFADLVRDLVGARHAVLYTRAAKWEIAAQSNAVKGEQFLFPARIDAPSPRSMLIGEQLGVPLGRDEIWGYLLAARKELSLHEERAARLSGEFTRDDADIAMELGRAAEAILQK